VASVLAGIKHNYQLHLVFKVEHRTPGKLCASIQTMLRNLKSGAMFEHRLRSADAIEKVVVDEVAMDLRVECCAEAVGATQGFIRGRKVVFCL
jgi:hypothetical protein